MTVALDARPKARQDLTITTEHEHGEALVVVSDPWGLQEASLLLSDKVYRLLQMLDGSRTLTEIERSCSRLSHEQRFSLSELADLVAQLDQLLLLDSATYRRAFESQVKGFLEASERAPAHAGISYPQDPEELVPWIDQILAAPGANAETCLGGAAGASFPAVVVAPHLDLRVEQEAYGAAYRGIQGMSPDRVVVLGTGHEIRGGLFSLTFKSYHSPLGEMPTDLDAIDLLLEAGQFVCSPHDLAHRSEHALEFQLPFLQRALARPDVPIVPILCGSLDPWLKRAKKLDDIPYIQSFVDALRSLITPQTLVVAGVDLAHIGRKFGHAHTGRALYEASHAHDKKLLEALCEGNARAFWKRNADVQDRFHCCGFSSLALLMAVMPGLRGEVKRHQYWFEDDTESAVSFAALHLYRQR